MQINALPDLLQLRDLQRQELYAAVDRERLVWQASTMPRHHQGVLSGLRVQLTTAWSRVAGQRYRPAPEATGTPTSTAFLHGSVG